MPLLLLLMLSIAPAEAASDKASTSVGKWWKGSLEHGVPLAAEGAHHYVVFQEKCYDGPRLSHLYPAEDRKDNFYGHRTVVDAVERVAAEVARLHPDAGRMPVGEISNASGGRIPRHLSHQNGLDVDVYFLQRSTSRYPVKLCHDGPEFERKDPTTGEWGVTPDFDPALNWDLVAAFARDKQVQKILIGALLKKSLKAWAEAHVDRRTRKKVLAKLKVPFCRAPRGVDPPFYRGNFCPHDDHIHVRFYCPKDGTSPRCRGGRR